MSFLQFAFYFFAIILIGAAARGVTVRNPVKAALYLVLAVFSAACIWITLEAEFLAIVLVLVYVGAVMVLFLFVVMTDIHEFHFEQREGHVITKDELLEIGDRYEPKIAADRRIDAEYR